MTFTSHGHHIPFTFLEDEKPEKVEGCGGVRVCLECTVEAMRYLPAFVTKHGRPSSDLEFLLTLQAAVEIRVRECLREVEVAQLNYTMFQNVTIAS